MWLPLVEPLDELSPVFVVLLPFARNRRFGLVVLTLPKTQRDQFTVVSRFVWPWNAPHCVVIKGDLGLVSKILMESGVTNWGSGALKY